MRNQYRALYKLSTSGHCQKLFVSDYSNFPRASVPPLPLEWSGVEWMQQWVMAPFNGTEDDAIIAASASARDTKRRGGGRHSTAARIESRE